MFRGKILLLLLFLFFIFTLDQLTKYLVHTSFYYGESLVIIPGFFNLTYVHNPGGAFGFLASCGDLVRKIAFIFISGFATCMVFYFYCKTPLRFTCLRIALAMIFSGALANMADRLRFAYVIDFLDFYIKDWHWPVFNIADSFICVGMFILFYHIVFKKLPENF